MSRRQSVVILVLLALVALACKNPEGGGSDPDDPPPSPVKGFPSSMVALGDSLTAAFGSCLVPTSCPRNSWSTGDGTQVNSHYRRILAKNPAIEDRNRNLAKPGATVADLIGQAETASTKKVDYVTVLIGTNDACEGDMTATGTFRSRLDEALGKIKKAMPKARLLLVSIPDVYRVWEIGHTNKVAVAAWRTGACPNLLTDPTSTSSEAQARREAFRERVAAYNAQLRQACSEYGTKCRYANIASFEFEFTMLSAFDFFHPNAAGQRALAEETYPGSFAW